MKKYYLQAFSLNGNYIGSEKDAIFLTEKYGIEPEKRTEKSSVCSIGYSEKKKLWYGWSHRAISGFATRAEAAKFAESVS